MAIEGFLDMFEARLHRHSVARKKRELGSAAGEALKSSEAMVGGELADGVHAGVKCEWR